MLIQALKVKIKSLAEEARIIRVEERRTSGMSKWQLQHHRRTVVRDAARRSLIAYATVRGRDPETHASDDPAVRHGDAKEVARMVRKYGPAEERAA